MEERHIAYCGYDCTKCPVHNETKNNNLKQLKKILYNNNPNETIDTLGCYGCKADKSINFMCVNCSIRQCAKEKKYDNCGLCEKFPCDNLLFISKETMEYLKKVNERKEKND